MEWKGMNEEKFFGFRGRGCLSRYVIHSRPSSFTSLVFNIGSMDGGLGRHYKGNFFGKSSCIARTDSDQVQVHSRPVSLLVVSA
jgi:hypothetical protein